MADRTESGTDVDAPAADVLAVVADFAAYPEWTDAVKSAEVLGTDDRGRALQVRFQLDAGAIKDTYTLRYDWSGVAADGQGELRWDLVEANLLTAMDGSYEFRETGGRTRVTYRLAVDLRIPMLGMLRRKAERVITDTALTELSRRVEG